LFSSTEKIMNLNLDLPPELENYVKQKVASGGFADESAVISHALIRAQETDERLAALNAAIAVGEEQADRGEGRPYTPEYAQEIKNRALARLQAEVDAPRNA
jgi:antitoxin ParD1/3/4